MICALKQADLKWTRQTGAHYTLIILPRFVHVHQVKANQLGTDWNMG